jgi:hypothetical protein
MKRCALILVLLAAAACGAQGQPAPAAPGADEAIVSNTASADAPATTEERDEPGDDLDPRVPACSQLIAAYDRYGACAAADADERTAKTSLADALRSALTAEPDVDDATMRAMNNGCVESLRGIRQIAQASGCTI